MLHSGYNLDTIKEDYYRDPPLSIHLKIIFLCLRYWGVAVNIGGVATWQKPSLPQEAAKLVPPAPSIDQPSE